MSELAILVPVLRRPHRVDPLLDSIAATTPGRPRVLFLTSPGDDAECAAIRRTRSRRSAVVVDAASVEGNYAAKINCGVRLTKTPLLFLGADDILFHEGWLEAAKRKLTGTVGVVGTNDLCNPRTLAGRHATHFLVSRAYVGRGTIDEPGKTLHEGYPHEYVDDEFVGTARKREAWAYAADAIVEHLHPMVGKAPVDELYAAQPTRMREGARLFRRRRRLWM